MEEPTAEDAVFAIKLIEAESNTITFHTSNTTPMIELRHNGDIYIKGKLVENDKDVVQGMRDFLATTNSYRPSLPVHRCPAAIKLVRDGVQAGAIQKIEHIDGILLATRVMVYGSGMRAGEVYLVQMSTESGDTEITVRVPDPHPVGFQIDADFCIYQNVNFIKLV